MARGPVTHHLTLYRYYKNVGQQNQSPLGLVFGAGTVQWSWGLDADHDNSIGTPADLNMQQATVNLLADMGAQPVTLQPKLLPGIPSADTVAPNSTITSPTSGNQLQSGNIVTIQGTASDTGGLVAGVEVSVDGGNTWHPATGRERPMSGTSQPALPQRTFEAERWTIVATSRYRQPGFPLSSLRQPALATFGTQR